MDWTWGLDDVVPTVVLLATAAGAFASLLLGVAVGAILLTRAARGRQALPRGFSWLASPLGRAAAGACVVMSIDGMYVNRGAWNMAAMVVAFLAQVLFVAGCAALRKPTAARAHAAAALLWLVCCLAMAGFSRFNLQLSRERSATVIAACRRFEKDWGHLPQALDELVPQYLPRIPTVDWTFVGSIGFLYRPQEKELMFAAPWPYLRVYDFGTDEWRWGGLLLGRDTSERGEPATARAAN